MAQQTKIEWADATWNPTSGCSPISEGCQNCWATRMAKRLAGRCGYPADDPFRVMFHPDRLEEPLRWKTPRRIAVSLMGDLFHESMKSDDIDLVFGVMAEASQHTYLLLTKRPGRMHFFLSKYNRWTLDNVWLGVSVENQRTADERIPWLLKCPAAVRYLSMEPLLGPVDLTAIQTQSTWPGKAEASKWHCLRGYTYSRRQRFVLNGIVEEKGVSPFVDLKNAGKIDWVIVGGETGPGARPMHPDWARSLRNQCRATGVPFFFKQWGEWMPLTIGDDPGAADVGWVRSIGDATYTYPSHFAKSPETLLNHGFAYMGRVGKNVAGRVLDGREWNEMPATYSSEAG